MRVFKSGNIIVNARMSRVHGGSDYFKLTIEDCKSNLQIIRIKMNNDQLANLLSNREASLMEAEIEMSGNIGKIRETLDLVFKVPDHFGGKDWAEKNAHRFCRKGYAADTYFRGQQSIRLHDDGEYYAHGYQFRYVDPK